MRGDQMPEGYVLVERYVLHEGVYKGVTHSPSTGNGSQAYPANLRPPTSSSSRLLAMRWRRQLPMAISS